MSPRGERTREQILDAAELLYGSRGVDAVSLREIRIAAGQRNTSAIQFHFGDADGLLVAIAQRHLPVIAVEQLSIRTSQIEQGANGVADLVDALVLPWAHYLERGPSERAWVKIAAAESARPERHVRDFQDHMPEIMWRTVGELYTHLCSFLPEAIAVERIMALSMMANHLCADRARAIDATASPVRPVISSDEFDANLVTMMRAAAAAIATDVTPAGAGAQPR